MKKLKSISTRSTSVKAFLDQASKIPVTTDSHATGRLVFGMDATASREPCWDTACQILADMFTETVALGQLQIQLCYYQGYKEFHASTWSKNALQLQRQMTSVHCKAGQTQIQRIFEHTALQAGNRKVNALVFIGDCMEESADSILETAGKLTLRGIPAFMFQEGYDPVAETTFRQIAQITRGAYCRFDQSSAKQLRALLNAVATYAVGGVQALKSMQQRAPALSNEIIKQLTDQSG